MTGREIVESWWRTRSGESATRGDRDLLAARIDAAMREARANTAHTAADSVEKSSPGEPYRTNTIFRLRMWAEDLRAGKETMP